MTTPDGKITVAPNQLAEWLHSALALQPGETPFPWQEQLLRRFLDGEVPAALDIPTGLGKTSVIPIWLVARAAGSRVPRRLVYVVDRRAVVDQSTSEAERLQELVGRMEALKRALGVKRRLPISTLRGQFIDNREWLEDPSEPAIVLGTVDMVGSRLLFSGYGVSAKMRPYHAGLLGTDALVVLDEAHLVQPFERLMDQLATGRDAQGRPLGPEDPTLQQLVPRLRFMSLSATGRDRSEGVLRLTDADARHDILRKRLTASKRLVIRAEVAENALPEVLAAEAWALAKAGTAPVRVIVFCTSRDDAQQVELLLRKKLPNPDDIELFVGGRRVFERTRAAQWLAGHGFLAGRGIRLERPAFVIATAAGEVGVDLDADHCACDLVAWERMVQRLGRVNRRGEGAAEIIVVPAARTDGNDARRLRAVRELFEALPKVCDGVDASPKALMGLRSNKDLLPLIEQGTTPAPLHPPLTRALIEAWSMTSLQDHTGRPEVAPWIRGWPDEAEKPQTSVVWRRYLPLTQGGELLSKRDLEAFRDAADPHLVERLETETWRVVEWLGRRVNAIKKRIPHDADAEPLTLALRATDVIGVVLDEREGARVVRAEDLEGRNNRADLDRTLQRATLLVDRRLGGLQAGLLAPDSDVDVDDVTESEEPRVVPFRIVHKHESDLVASSSDWRVETQIPIRKSDEGATEWLSIESLIEEAAESEEGRSGAKRDQLLDEHQKWAEVQAQQITQRLGLPVGYAELVAFCARRHDEGKRAPCWQRAFHARAGETYAKTTRAPDLKVLAGYRHELGSLPYVEAKAQFKALPVELRELCLHLIASHHGYARPIIRTSGAPEPPSKLVVRAQQIALRFSELERRWGPWGLAWWEALLRAADQQASRRNDLDGGENG